MDLLSLRTAIQSTLNSVLGTYTLANGATTQAISVRAPGESLPAGTTVTGLEVVIVREPELVAVRQYQNEQALAAGPYTWSIGTAVTACKTWPAIFFGRTPAVTR